MGAPMLNGPRLSPEVAPWTEIAQTLVTHFGTDKMTNCCDEISDPTPIHVASRIVQDHDPIEAGSFMESDRIEKSWREINDPITFSEWSDRFWNRAQATQGARASAAVILPM